jgi:hypothetical protein
MVKELRQQFSSLWLDVESGRRPRRAGLQHLVRVWGVPCVKEEIF